MLTPEEREWLKQKQKREREAMGGNMMEGPRDNGDKDLFRREVKSECECAHCRIQKEQQVPNKEHAKAQEKDW